MSVVDALLRAVCRSLERQLVEAAEGRNVDVDAHVDRAVGELAAILDLREHGDELRAPARAWLRSELAQAALRTPSGRPGGGKKRR